jgi:MFS family permease
MLTIGGFLLMGGRLGDLYGHRRLFLAGIVLFTVASAACGLSYSQGMLVVARAMQGLGGAIVSAVALSLMMNLFPEPAERAPAMSVYSFVCADGGSIGAIAGGLLIDLLNWHWIFLVNLPIGVAVYAACLKLVPPAQSQTAPGKLGLGGAFTVTIALMLAVYAIVNGSEAGWHSMQTVGLLAGAVVFFCRVPDHGSEGGVAAGAAGHVLPAQSVDGQRSRYALVGRDVCLVLYLGAPHAVDPRLSAAPGRPGLSAGQHHHNHVFAGLVGQNRHALRHYAPAGGRPLDRHGRPGAVCASAVAR